MFLSLSSGDNLVGVASEGCVVNEVGVVNKVGVVFEVGVVIKVGVVNEVGVVVEVGVVSLPAPPLKVTLLSADDLMP